MSDWSLVTGQSAHAFGGSGNFVSASLPNFPTIGNVVCIGTGFFSNTDNVPPTIIIKDENNNNYIITPNSPSSDPTNVSGIIFLAYFLVKGTPGKTINVQFSKVATFSDIYIDEFHLASGVITFDSDVAATGTGLTVNTPVVPVHSPDALCFSATAIQTTISSCDSPWTTDPGGIDSTTGWAAEYLLGASGNQAVAYTASSSGIWSGMSMSFKTTPDAYNVSRRIVRSTQPA